MNLNSIGIRPNLRRVVVGMVLIASGMPATRADDELNAAAASLALAGSDFVRARGGRVPTGGVSATAAATRDPAALKGPAAVVEAPFEGVFVGTLGEELGDLRAHFTGAKVQWVEPGKRTWSPKVTNGYTFTMAAGQLTVNRAGSAPLVYRIGEGRKALSLESGDGKMVPKELRAAQP